MEISVITDPEISLPGNLTTILGVRARLLLRKNGFYKPKKRLAVAARAYTRPPAVEFIVVVA